MNAMAPPRPAELHGCQAAPGRGPGRAGEARRQVRAAIRAWDVPVDEDVAVLLASELVTNAITHQGGRTVALALTCSPGRLRVDVHDTSRSLPVLASVPAEPRPGAA